MTEKDRIQIQVLIERHIYQQLVELAQSNDRSLASQVRVILKSHLVKETR